MVNGWCTYLVFDLGTYATDHILRYSFWFSTEYINNHHQINYIYIILPIPHTLHLFLISLARVKPFLGSRSNPYLKYRVGKTRMNDCYPFLLDFLGNLVLPNPIEMKWDFRINNYQYHPFKPDYESFFYWWHYCFIAGAIDIHKISEDFEDC